MPGDERSAATSGGVLAIGDSVMLGASDALSSAIGAITVDAVVSRQFSTGVEIIGSLAASGQLPGTVIVHLGTNGEIGSGDCEQMMSMLTGRRVVLVTLEVPRAWEDGNNAVIRSCAASHGATLADWGSVASGELLAGDGYHLTASGASVYGQLIASIL